MSWKTVQITMPEVSAVLDAVDTVNDVLDVLDAAYTLVLPGLKLLTAAQSTVAGAGAASAAAIQAAKALVLSLNNEAGVYLLSVPLLASAKGTLSLPHMPVQSLADVGRTFGVRAPSADYNIAGNYGLFRAITESLYDAADISRPSLDPSKYTAVTLMVYGGDSFVEALPQVVALSELFGDAVPVPVHGYVLPVPQNVKLRSVPTPAKPTRGRVLINLGGGAQTTSLAVRWDEDAPYARLPGYKNTTSRRIAWRIYAKRDRKIAAGEDLSAYQVYEREIVSAAIPSIGTLYDDNTYGGVLTGLDPDTTYFVSVAYVVEIYNSATGAKTVIEPVTSSLSDQQRVRMRERPVPRQMSRGVPPDWVALKGALGAIPPVARAVESAVNELELLEAQVLGSTGAASTALTTAADVPSRIRAQLTGITDQIERAARIVGSVSGGVWVTATAMTGGDTSLVRWLQQELLDNNVEGQPPFKTGDGVVGALVFVAQADSLDAALAALGTLSEIAGGNPSSAPAIISIADPTRGVSPPDNATDPEKSLHDLGVGDDPC